MLSWTRFQEEVRRRDWDSVRSKGSGSGTDEGGESSPQGDDETPALLGCWSSLDLSTGGQTVASVVHVQVTNICVTDR